MTVPVPAIVGTDGADQSAPGRTSPRLSAPSRRRGCSSEDRDKRVEQPEPGEDPVGQGLVVAARARGGQVAQPGARCPSQSRVTNGAKPDGMEWFPPSTIRKKHTESWPEGSVGGSWGRECGRCALAHSTYGAGAHRTARTAASRVEAVHRLHCLVK